MDEAKVQPRRLSHLSHKIRIVANADIGELDFDAVAADRPNDWLGNAALVDAFGNDLDRLRDLLPLPGGILGPRRALINLQRERHAAREIKSALHAALGLA